MKDILNWIEETRELGDNGRHVTRAANANEREAIAQMLDLLDCDELQFDYQLKPHGDGRYRLRGEVTARVTQACVVSLEPVHDEIGETVDLEFWPEHLLDQTTAKGERSILEGDDPEALGPHGRIDTGRIALEVLSASLDPYPRKQGAEFEWREEEGAEGTEAAAHPFAALAKLKERLPEK